MKTLLKFEFERTIHDLILMLVLAVCPLLLAFIVMRFGGAVIISAIMTINRTQWLLDFLCIPDYITSITYKQAAMVIMTFLNIVMVYLSVTKSAASFWQEKRSGMLLYFFSQPVTRISIYTVKASLAWMRYIICMLPMYGIVMLMSLHGVSHPVLKEIIIDRVIWMMTPLVLVNAMGLSIGLVIGAVSSEYPAKIWINRIFILMLILCILPNLFNVLIQSLQDKSLNLSILIHLKNFFTTVRSYIPLHWCSPWIYVGEGLGQWRSLLCVIVSIIGTGAGAIIFQKRKLI